MGLKVRAVDVGFGHTKFVRGHDEHGKAVCAEFPSRAYASPFDPAGTLGSDMRRTYTVPIDGLFYEVGPDVMLAADAFRARDVHGDYIESPQYMALSRGALSMMELTEIDLLVVGLPVAVYAAMKPRLESLMTGRHDVGGGREVTVHKALAMAQPNGALVDFATSNGRVESMANEYSLVIDPGTRTFDWLVAKGMTLSSKQSHSVERGMSDILQLIADDVGRHAGRPYANLDNIDQALRNGKGLVVQDRQISHARLRSMAEIIVKDAVAAMVRRIGNARDVDNVILVGGAVHLFRRLVKDAFPNHQVREAKEAIFANVRGYQIAGENYAFSVMRDREAKSLSAPQEALR